MNEERKDWIIGFGIFLVIATLVYMFSGWISPYNHLSWLESFGVVMMFISLKTGIDTFRDNP